MNVIIDVDHGSALARAYHRWNRRRLVVALSLLLFASTSPRATAQPQRLRAVERQGKIVVLVADVRSGRLVAVANRQWSNRAEYGPGSVFKLAIALAALRSGSFEPGWSFTCRGVDTLKGHAWSCWTRSGHGRLALSEAIANSCNLYFRRIASTISRREILDAGRSVGLVPRSAAAGDPDRVLSDERLLGDAFMISPSQMMTVALAFASRGRRSPSHIDLFGARYAPLYRGLRDCIRNGTGREAASARFSMGGKTGTSLDTDRPNGTAGWFIGFAPFDEPRYAIVVLDRRGRGLDAARLARQVLEGLL